ncbi:hypothetical protein HN51_066146 [Arachis hypogaea]
MVEQYNGVWQHSRVSRYLTSEDWPGPESKGKPWYDLLMLLRKYPEHCKHQVQRPSHLGVCFSCLSTLLNFLPCLFFGSII